ncbi:MAG: P13 family porin [Candidatus Sericytochromatia bacterium]
MLKRFICVCFGLIPLCLTSQVIASPLTETELDLEARRQRYRAEAIKPSEIHFANLITPLGIGSFSHGDIWGGVAVSLFDTVGLVFLGLTGFALIDGNVYGVWGYGTYAVLGLGMGRLIGAIAPDFYANETNGRLRRELRLDQDLNPLAPQHSQQTPLFFSYSTSF